jgi:stage V sporulation protein G
MDITEVRIKLIDEAGDRLQAFCSVTFDHCFVVRDLKIIEGASGPFVAMPSRKLTGRCPQCGCKNHLRASYCNQCGGRIPEERVLRDESGRTKLYADVAHPINAACREMIQSRVVAEYREELERAKQPGYVSRYDDYDLGDDYDQPEATTPGAPPIENEARRRLHHTKVEPAESPRGPHRPPSHARHRRHPGGGQEFGAGIL